MTENLKLRRKWTLRAHGKQVVFIKKINESDIHVLTKAFIWALFLPDYPHLAVEIKGDGRYKPDLVQFGDNGEPVFWGEAGQVGLKKMKDLVQRYRNTHLVFAKWQLYFLSGCVMHFLLLKKATKLATIVPFYVAQILTCPRSFVAKR